MQRLLGLLGIGLVCCAAPVLAEEWILRDRSGRRVGTLEEGYGDRLIRRDPSGRRLGTIEHR